MKDKTKINHFLRNLFILSISVVLLFSDYHYISFASTKEIESFQEIDIFVTEQMKNLKIPGVAIGIVKGDQTLYLQGYGIADENGRAVTPETSFLIASLSKPITAAGIMQLVEEEKLELDAPVQNYLTWFQVADRDFSSQITIRHLLNHTSGFSERNGYKRNLNTDPDSNALEKSIRNLKDEKLEFPPGSKFEYSNTNYDILGLLIQKVSGRSYETYIQESLFTPLEMKDSYTALESARSGKLANGYFPFFGFLTSSDQLMPYSKITKPSAGLFSSAEDLTHFLIANLNNGIFLDKSILSPIGMSDLLSNRTQFNDNAGYALGWTVFPFPDLAPATPDDTIPMVLSHAGEWVGYTSLLVMIPELETGIVLLMNKSDITKTTELFNLGWSLTMFAVGLDPVVFPSSDFVNRNVHSLLIAVLILLSIGLVWSLRKIRGFSAHSLINSNRVLCTQTVIFAILDFIIAFGLLFIWFPQSNDTIALALRFNLDIGLLYLLILMLTIGWGLVRTMLFLKQLFKSKTHISS